MFRLNWYFGAMIFALRFLFQKVLLGQGQVESIFESQRFPSLGSLRELFARGRGLFSYEQAERALRVRLKGSIHAFRVIL